MDLEYPQDTWLQSEPRRRGRHCYRPVEAKSRRAYAQAPHVPAEHKCFLLHTPIRENQAAQALWKAIWQCPSK